jgi:hypothetical protein
VGIPVAPAEVLNRRPRYGPLDERDFPYCVGIVPGQFLYLGLGRVGMRHRRGLAGITQALGGLFSEPVALVYLSQKQTGGIGGYPVGGKVGDNLLTEKAFKDELVIEDCFHRVSRLRSCLFLRLQHVSRYPFFFTIFRE